MDVKEPRDRYGALGWLSVAKLALAGATVSTGWGMAHGDARNDDDIDWYEWVTPRTTPAARTETSADPRPSRGRVS